MARPDKPRRFTRIGLLKLTQPAEWERRVREAMAASDGRVDEAAEILGCSRRTLFRYLDEPVLEDVARARAGKPRG